MMQPELDTEFVRSRFPAFAEPALAGQAFFENAGGSYTCAPVIERLCRFYRSRKVQPYAPYEASRLAGEEMDEARTRLAALLGVEEDELSFGPSTTQNTYVLAQAFRRHLNPGDAIIVTNQDHEANSGPWRRLGDEGFEIREWRMDPETGHLDIAALERLLDARVRLVCFPHCSNVVGEINDVTAICARVRAAGAWSCVDGVSYAPHGLPDVGALGADIYMFSAYKTYGPHQGLVVIRRALAEALPAQGHWFNAGDPAKRFVPAGPDHAQVAAAAGMADYLDQLYVHHFAAEDPPAVFSATSPAARARAVHDLMRAHEIRLMAPLLDFFRERRDLRLLGPAQSAGRAPTIAVEAAAPGEELAARLATFGIMAGGGNFYAVRTLEGMGIDPAKGVLRLSFVHYTVSEEIAKLIGALEQVL